MAVVNTIPDDAPDTGVPDAPGAELAASGGVLKFTLDRQTVCLKLAEHFYLGSTDAAKAGVL